MNAEQTRYQPILLKTYVHKWLTFAIVEQKNTTTTNRCCCLTIEHKFVLLQIHMVGLLCVYELRRCDVCNGTKKKKSIVLDARINFSVRPRPMVWKKQTKSKLYRLLLVCTLRLCKCSKWMSFGSHSSHSCVCRLWNDDHALNSSSISQANTIVHDERINAKQKQKHYTK